jgi:uncharacterized protein
MSRPPVTGFFLRALRDADDRPQPVGPLEFVRSLHFQMLETFGDDTQDMLYRNGYEWGLQEMRALNARLRAEYGAESDLWQMDPKFVLESWWAPLLAGGWGVWSINPTAKARGITVIDLRNSLVADALPGAEFPVCHLYAGLFAGAFSFFERTERHGVEINCRAAGAEMCTFVIGPGSEIDSVETSRQQGASAADLVARFR